MGDRKDLEGKVRKKLEKVMSSLDRLISQIEDLDQAINEYRGYYGYGADDVRERQFCDGSEFTRPLQRLQDLKAWRRESGYE